MGGLSSRAWRVSETGHVRCVGQPEELANGKSVIIPKGWGTLYGFAVTDELAAAAGLSLPIVLRTVVE
ncbi:hypothetical protein AArc1_3236 [Natrarchaeobaculum sulfurireducens]|uniref:Uncharacterized protein n=1 Tax=Natrarchaeobaculum sulfurireducens TaxID=2044521 RepID=A0A346PJ44_9EURY|nr:hypothetical protein AArc1_3236 [Natrarchaeobaculum sulfurireducens]